MRLSRMINLILLEIKRKNLRGRAMNVVIEDRVRANYFKRFGKDLIIEGEK